MHLRFIFYSTPGGVAPVAVTLDTRFIEVLLILKLFELFLLLWLRSPASTVGKRGFPAVPSQSEDGVRCPDCNSYLLWVTLKLDRVYLGKWIFPK